MSEDATTKELAPPVQVFVASMCYCWCCRRFKGYVCG